LRFPRPPRKRGTDRAYKTLEAISRGLGITKAETPKQKKNMLKKNLLEVVYKEKLRILRAKKLEKKSGAPPFTRADGLTQELL